MLYDPKSHKAEEFINHEEVLASLDYAEKNNMLLFSLCLWLIMLMLEKSITCVSTVNGDVAADGR